MKLINVIIEASKTTHSFGLRRKQAETVLRAVVEWIEQQDDLMDMNHDNVSWTALAQRLRDEILIGRTPK